MKRILISQNETNNNTDYVLENGILIEDKAVVDDLHHEVNNSYLDAEMIYQNGDLRVKKIDNKIIIQSYYADTDVAGRRIFYMFYIDDFKSITPEDIVEYLKKDSEMLSRSIDVEDEVRLRGNLKRVLSELEDLISKILENKRVIAIAFIIFLGLLGLYLLTNK